MTIKSVATTLHTVLGLISGMIVFVVSLTGAVWALNIYGWVDEDKTEQTPIPASESQWLRPSQLRQIALDSLGYEPTYISYIKGGPVLVAKYSMPRRTMYLNPVTGKPLPGQEKEQQVHGKGKGKFDGKRSGKRPYTIWQWAREGHRHLWLPRKIGSPIVNYGTLCFVVVLLTGVVRWWPKKLKYIGKVSKIRTGRSRSMLFYSLHSVLGAYITPVLLIIAFTGMVWGISWWSEGVYWATTGGKTLVKRGSAASDTTQYLSATALTGDQAIDRVFAMGLKRGSEAQVISISLPDSTKASTVGLIIAPERGVYYNNDRYSYDRYTLRPITTDGPYDGRYATLSWGDRLRRMNYELHVGSIAGEIGHIFVFLAALIGILLPSTGFYLYFFRKTRRRSKR